MGYNDDEDFEFEYDEQSQGNGPADLRRALKAAQKRAKELEAENAKLAGQVATRSLADVLTKKDLPQGLGRFILQDKVDPSDELAVNKWLHENQSVFRFQLKTEGQESGTEDAGSEEDQSTKEYREQYARMHNASTGSLPDDRYAEAHKQIKGSKNTAETQAALDRAIKNQI